MTLDISSPAALSDLTAVASDLFRRGGRFNLTSECHGRSPLSRTAVIVPYRDRMENLEAALAYLHPFLAEQGIDYKIDVVSQVNAKSPKLSIRNSQQLLSF